VLGLDSVPHPLDHPFHAVGMLWDDWQLVLVNVDRFGLGQDRKRQLDLLARREVAGEFGVEQQLLGCVVDLIGVPAGAASLPIMDHQGVWFFHDQVHAA
jgi:hypothetical protein